MENPQSNHIVFTIARMNPPTIGHMLLIKQMMNKALQIGGNKIGIILSHTVDDDKNPLECEEKREILLLHGMIDNIKEQMKNETNDQFIKNNIDEIQINILCKDDSIVQEQQGNFPIQSINALLLEYGYPINYPNTELHLLVGEDRATSYDWLTRIFNNKTPSVKLNIEALSRPEGAMSATYIRNLVKDGKREEFIEEMKKTGIDDETSERIYNQLNTIFITAASKQKTKKNKGKKGGSKRLKGSRRRLKGSRRRLKGSRRR